MAVYKIKKRRNNEEHLTQVACVNWFGYAYPRIADLLFAIPNGGHRHMTVAKELKKEGVRRGVPDLQLAYPVGVYSGLFIEMKSRTGRVSKNQKKYIERLREVGYRVEVVKSFDEFKELIDEYLYD